MFLRFLLDLLHKCEFSKLLMNWYRQLFVINSVRLDLKYK